MREDITQQFPDYELLDSGDFEKLERFGKYIVRRPEPQAIWHKNRSEEDWRRLADASFRRDDKGGKGADKGERGEWTLRPSTPSRWWTEFRYGDMRLRMRIGLTSFKHVGIFPEQSSNWTFIYDRCRDLVAKGMKPRVLNLFAYTGGATLAACAGGADVTHVDSVKPVVTWACENMEESGLEGVRWIVEDALKFVRREVRRGNRYNGIILDPPAYGRGADGEKWVLEENIGEMLECCAALLEPKNAFIVLNLYSMGLSSMIARTAVRQSFGAPVGEQFGELYFEDSFAKRLPLGTYYRFVR